MSKLIPYADRLARSLWERAARNISTDLTSLALFRIVFGLFSLLFLTPSFGWIKDAPQAFFDPPYLSFANLLPSFPGGAFFATLDVLAVLLLVFITLGVKARLSAVAFFIITVTGDSFAYSFGKIDHSFLSAVLPLCLAFSGWGTKYALLPDKPRRLDSVGLSLSAYAVLVAFGMFTAGFVKSLFWVDFNVSTSGFLSWFYGGYYNLGRTNLLASLVPLVPTTFFELADYAAVAFELSGFLFLLSGRRAWRLWLTLAATFHLLNVLTLNIGFISHFVVYLAFVDFSKLAGVWEPRRKPLKIGLVALTAALGLAHLGGLYTGNTFSLAGWLAPANSRLLGLYFAVGIWLSAFLILGWNLYAARGKREPALSAQRQPS